MKRFLNSLFFLICLFSSKGLSAAHVQNYAIPKDQSKIYLNLNDLEVTENIIYIHLENNLIETKALRTDHQGVYILESDITNYGATPEKKWRCPYCYRWWLFGEKCQNKECPTNQWEKEDKSEL